MSYNIDQCLYVPGTGPLRMRPSAARKAVRQSENRPETNFLDNDIDCDVDGDEPQTIVDPWWVGEGSGRSEDEYRAALALTEGSADIILTWEGGDSFSGLRVVDGVVTEHEVVMRLGAAK